MYRFLVVLLIAGVAFSQDVDKFGRKIMKTSAELDISKAIERGYNQTINGTNYFFSGDQSYYDYQTASDLCKGLRMKMVGFETQEEYDAVANQMNVLGYTYWYWTSGTFMSKDANGTSFWTWGANGTTFDSNDPNWDAGEPDVLDNEYVSLYVVPKVLWAETATILNHAMCEQV